VSWWNGTTQNGKSSELDKLATAFDNEAKFSLERITYCLLSQDGATKSNFVAVSSSGIFEQRLTLLNVCSSCAQPKLKQI
jgi:hypothetical protein